MTARIEAIFVGGPRELRDAKGVWSSSIARPLCDAPVQVNLRGLEGDAVMQPYHGGPDAALCVHLTDHYRFWNERFGLVLASGSVGENLTVGGLTEDEVCAGDVVRLGSVLAQVSGPRVPCANLARHIGRADWVKLTVRENRTGFYLRVLEPGTVQAGDAWMLEERWNAGATVPAINRCMYLSFDQEMAGRMVEMPGLAEWWRQQAREKLLSREAHWTSGLRQDAGAQG